MNDLTRSVVLEAGQKPRYRKRAAFRFEVFLREVDQFYTVRVRAGPGATLMDRAVRLARRLWRTPECFDSADPCDNCSIALSRGLSDNYWFWWLALHPEWQLDPLAEEDVLSLLFEAPAGPEPAVANRPVQQSLF